jgi:hypothetical protein
MGVGSVYLYTYTTAFSLDLHYADLYWQRTGITFCCVDSVVQVIYGIGVNDFGASRISDPHMCVA